MLRCQPNSPRDTLRLLESHSSCNDDRTRKRDSRDTLVNLANILVRNLAPLRLSILDLLRQTLLQPFDLIQSFSASRLEVTLFPSERIKLCLQLRATIIALGRLRQIYSGADSVLYVNLLSSSLPSLKSNFTGQREGFEAAQLARDRVGIGKGVARFKAIPSSCLCRRINYSRAWS